MNNLETIIYLLNGLRKREYDIRAFCSEYIAAYRNLTSGEISNEQLETQLDELLEIVARFSDYEEDLKLKNVYFSEEDIRKKASEILELV